jgi:hypothetical protein
LNIRPGETEAFRAVKIQRLNRRKEAMSSAFGAACLELKLTDLPNDTLRNVVARKVIEWAQRGERNSERLCGIREAAATG